MLCESCQIWSNSPRPTTFHEKSVTHMYKSPCTERASAKGVSRILHPLHASVRQTQNGMVGCFLRTNLSSTPLSEKHASPPQLHQLGRSRLPRQNKSPSTLTQITRSHKNSNRTSTWHQQCPIHCQRFGKHSQALQFTPILLLTSHKNASPIET